MTAVITIAWAIALVVVLVLRPQLPADEQWWVWTCVAGLCMGLFGLWVIGAIVWHALHGTVPEPLTMGVIGFVALAVNAADSTVGYDRETITREARREILIVEGPQNEAGTDQGEIDKLFD